jgi:agmatine deiminase
MPESYNAAARGFTMPAEWEEQRAVLLSWPLNPATWEDRRTAVETVYAGFAAAISHFEAVKINCVRSEQPRISKLLSDAGADAARIELPYVPTNDAWCRDHGPVCLVNRSSGARLLNHYLYNSWGGKFPPWDLDAAVPEHAAALLGYERNPVPMVCEGGALESNGAGLLMTTESVMLNPNRNPSMTRAEIGDMLMASLGVDEILWLKGGLFCDDTDGHIDTLARFVNPDTVLACVAPEGSPNAPMLKENLRRLHEYRTRLGRPLDVIPLPLPDPVAPPDGWREETLPASYANYLLVNGAVLVPSYRQPRNDARAAAIIGEAFPGRTVVSIDCADIILEGGALHCLSQNLF